MFRKRVTGALRVFVFHSCNLYYNVANPGCVGVKWSRRVMKPTGCSGCVFYVWTYFRLTPYTMAADMSGNILRGVTWTDSKVTCLKCLLRGFQYGGRADWWEERKFPVGASILISCTIGRHLGLRTSTRDCATCLQCSTSHCRGTTEHKVSMRCGLPAPVGMSYLKFGVVFLAATSRFGAPAYPEDGGRCLFPKALTVLFHIPEHH